MDLFADGANLHRSFYREKVYSKPRRDGVRSQRQPLSIRHLSSSLDALKEWANSPTTIKLVRRDPPVHNSMVPEPPQLSYSKAGKPPTILRDRSLLKFSILSTQTVADKMPDYGIGQQLTRIQRYKESLEQRRRAAIDSFLKYVDELMASLYVDFDRARAAFQDYLSSVDSRFIKLAKNPDVRPQIMYTTFQSIETEALGVYSTLHTKLDNLALTLKDVITDAIKTLSVSLKQACCTEDEILSYLRDIVQQTEDRMNGVCTAMLLFAESCNNRTLSSIEDGRATCHRIIYQRKIKLVYDTVEQYTSFIHHEHEFSPVIMDVVFAINTSLQQFSAHILHFVTGLSIKNEHPRDMAVRLVKEIFLPHKQDLHYLLEDLEQTIDDVHLSLTESSREIILSLEQLNILDDGLRNLIVEILNHWEKRWKHRLTLIKETVARVLHANSFFIACIIALFSAADTAIKHATSLDDKWRRLCDEAVKAVEERFVRDWSRGTNCLRYINENIESIWEVSEAKKVKKISGELLDALEEGIVQREKRILDTTGLTPSENIFLRTLFDVVSLELKEAGFLTLCGLIADQDDALLSNITLFNDTLAKNPFERIPLSEMVGKKSYPIHNVAFPENITAPWSCADYQISVLDELISERGMDLKVISSRAKEKEQAAAVASSQVSEPHDSIPASAKQPSKPATPARASSKARSRAATPTTNKKRPGSKGAAAPVQESVTDEAGEQKLLIDLPNFENDVNIAEYVRVYGFSFFQDAVTPEELMAEMIKRFTAESSTKDKDKDKDKDKGKGKQAAQAPERKSTALNLVVPGYQQVFFSEEMPQEQTYTCLFMNIPIDLRLILYHALLRLLYADGERMAYNQAVSDFKDHVSTYRTAYLQKINAAAVEAHVAAVAEWEKEVAKKTKAAGKPKPASSRPDSKQEGDGNPKRPPEPTLVTELPDYVEDAIASIQIPPERELDSREVYVKLVYAVLPYDYLKSIPLTDGQAYPPPPQSASATLSPPPPSKPLLLRDYTRSQELQDFESVLTNARYSITMDEMIFVDCMYEGARETLEQLSRLAMATKPQAPARSESTTSAKRPPSKPGATDRQAASKASVSISNAGAGAERSQDEVLADNINKLLTLARPKAPVSTPLNTSARASGYKSILKDTTPTLASVSNSTGPLGILGADPSQQGQQTDTQNAQMTNILTDCRMYDSSNSLILKLLLGNISVYTLSLIVSRFVQSYSSISATSHTIRNRILIASDDLRTSLVPYSVRLLNAEVSQIESRNSRYVSIEYRTINRALGILTTLRRRILDASPLSASNPAKTQPTSAAGARASSRGKPIPVAPGESKQLQDALAVLASKGLDKFVTLTFDDKRGVVSSVQLTNALLELHPLFRHVKDIANEKFTRVVNENIALFPEQADRTVIYTCDAFIAECKTFLRDNIATLALNDISFAERIARSFSKQAAGWSGLNDAGPFDFSVADFPVAMLRNNYTEVKPLIDVVVDPVGMHPAIQVASALTETIQMVREELQSRLLSDLLFFKHLIKETSAAIRQINSEYIAKVLSVKHLKTKCTTIKIMALNRLHLFTDQMEDIGAAFTRAAKCPNKLSLNTIFTNALAAIEVSFKLETIAYYLSYSTTLRFIFYSGELPLINQHHTYLHPYSLFCQRSKAFHAFSGALLGIILSALNIMCSTQALQTPFTFQEAVKGKGSSPRSRGTSGRRSLSPKRLITTKTETVARTVSLQRVDIYSLGKANFAKIQPYLPRKTTYKPGAKVCYNNVVECDIGSQLQMELEAMLGLYPAFQPVYTPSKEEWASVPMPTISQNELDGVEIVSAKEQRKGSRPESALSERPPSVYTPPKQVVLPNAVIKRLKDSKFQDEIELLQHYYREMYDDVEHATGDARAQLHELMVQRDKVFDVILKQFVASAFEVIQHTINHVWKTYLAEHKANKDELTAKCTGVYDSLRPMLIKFPERAIAMQETVKEAVTKYTEAEKLVSASMRKDLRILLTVANCILITAPAILLSLYPSWASDTRMACCASLQFAELLSTMVSSVDKQGTPQKGAGTGAAAKKRPGGDAKPGQSGTEEGPDTSEAIRLLDNEESTNVLVDSCQSQELGIVPCSVTFLQTIQLIEDAIATGKTIFDVSDPKAFPAAADTGAAAAKGKEQPTFLQGAVLPVDGTEFTATNSTQLEVLQNTLIGKDTLISDVPALKTLTHLDLNEITHRLLKQKRQAMDVQQQPPPASKEKDKRKPPADQKKPGGTASADEPMMPPAIYYKLGHLSFLLAECFTDSADNDVFCNLPGKLQTLVGCSHNSLKIFLKSLKNAQRLNALVAKLLEEAETIAADAASDLQNTKDEFVQAFSILNNANLANFSI